MRYNTPVFFQHKQPGAYNSDTHNYNADTITELKRYADITLTDTETLQAVYGTIKQAGLTLRLQRPYTAPFESIRIGAKIYAVGASKGGKVFVISEVKTNA